MPEWAVIPTIRVPDMERALEFYQDTLGFALARGAPDTGNISLIRGDARVMLEVPGPFFSTEYNEAIAKRVGTASAVALYMEAHDLDELYQRLVDSGVTIADPLAERPWGQREFTIEDHVGTWLTFWKANG